MQGVCEPLVTVDTPSPVTAPPHGLLDEKHPTLFMQQHVKDHSRYPSRLPQKSTKFLFYYICTLLLISTAYFYGI